MSSLEPGRRIGEHLELVRPLGQGAMGEVWEARHLNLETLVAVKFIHPTFAADPEIVARFAVEAKAAAQLTSPHVVRIFDHGTNGDVPYLVMERLEGENLDELLEREHQLAPTQAASIVAQVAIALGAAHARGIVHRDVKPANIFLCSDHDDDLFVKLLDFGVARATGFSDRKLTRTGTMIGTPSYISREMVTQPGPVDHRADLWALAVVAYEMLTGDVPFIGDTVGSICISIVKGEPIAASSLAKVPQAVDAFFARAFAADIEARFSSASELSRAFDAALAGEAPDVVAVAPSPPKRLAPPGAETLPPRRAPPTGDPSPREPSPSVEVIATLDAAPQPAPRRRWPWLFAALAIAAATFLLLHTRQPEGSPEPAPGVAERASPPSEPDVSAASPELLPSSVAPQPHAEDPPAEPSPPAARPVPHRAPGGEPTAPHPPALPEPKVEGRDDYGF